MLDWRLCRRKVETTLAIGWLDNRVLPIGWLDNRVLPISGVIA